MKFQVIHQNKSRIRVKAPFLCTYAVRQYLMARARENTAINKIDFYADEYYLAVTVNEGETIDAAIDFLCQLSQQEINQCLEAPFYQEETAYSIMSTVIGQHVLRRLFLPAPLSYLHTLYQASTYIKKSLVALKQKKLTMDVLDASAIVVSILMGQSKTASSIMFIMGLGERLDAWSNKKSIEDLEESLKSKTTLLWVKDDNGEIKQCNSQEIKLNDIIIVSEGNEILFDGKIVNGQGMVNESSLTGEFFPIAKTIDDLVYSNTVLESGELHVQVTNEQQNNRVYELIQLMKDAENQQENKQQSFIQLADRLVKYNFLGMAVTYLLTRSFNKALSFLLVDFSCALKLSTPITYLSAVKEAMGQDIIVKNSTVLEKYQHIDTFVFDKTGTLTISVPKIYKTIPFYGYSKEEVLKISACLEEHIHHPLANAVVQQAAEEGIEHEEMHGDLNYIASRGIQSHIDGEDIVIGSYLLMKETGIEITPEQYVIIDDFKHHYNLLYLGYQQQLIAIFLIETPLREETASVLQQLSQLGKRLVLLTGDTRERTMQMMSHLPFDDIQTNLTPQEKYDYIQQLKTEGRSVFMLGDGLNDSAAISLSDVGAVMGESADITKQTSDLILANNNLNALMTLKNISDTLAMTLDNNVKQTVTINSGLIILGVINVLSPSALSILHNLTTTHIILKSMSIFKSQ